MTIKRRACRATERVKMKKMHGQGFTVNQISNQLAVTTDIVEQVINGDWDSVEKAKHLATMERDRQESLAAGNAENERIVQIAAVVASTIAQQQATPINEETLRAQIEAEVRAEVDAEREEPLEADEKVPADEIDLDAAADAMEGAA